MSTGGGTARSDLLGGAGWVGFGLLVVAESLRMDRFTSMGATLYTMPGFMPGIVGSVIALLGAILALRGWRRARQAGAVPGTAQPAGAEHRLLNPRMLVALPLALLYAGVLLGRLPFWLATGLFVGAFTGAFMPPESGLRRRVLVSVASAVLTTAVVMVVFQHIFLVRLP